MTPARTTLVLPEPEGPTTAKKRVCSRFCVIRLVSSSRPKKIGASASLNAANPLYGGPRSARWVVARACPALVRTASTNSCSPSASRSLSRSHSNSLEERRHHIAWRKSSAWQQDRDETQLRRAVSVHQ